MVMVNVIGSIVLGGAAVALPAGLAIAGAMANRARKDEETRATEKRQREAKITIRKYVDDALFVAAKESRDVIRHSKRQLRDYFSVISADVNASTKRTLEASHRAHQSTVAEREKRSRVVAQLQSRLEAERANLLAFSAEF